MLRFTARATSNRRAAKTSILQNATPVNAQITSRIRQIRTAYTLYNGVKVPELAFQCSASRDGIAKSIKGAISLGYRYFDITTTFNEQNFLKDTLWRLSKINRTELFVASKVQVTKFDKMENELYYNLRGLRTGYLDLWILKWPVGDKERTAKTQPEDRQIVVDFMHAWKKMEEVYEAGKVKAIGVAYCGQPELMHLMEHAKIKPMVHYMEITPHSTDTEWVDWNKKQGIQVAAWYEHGYDHKSFGDGIFQILEEPRLAIIGAKYKLSPEETIIAWHISRNEIVVPFQYNNNEAFAYWRSRIQLEQNDIDAIDALDRGRKTRHPKDCAWGEYSKKEGLKTIVKPAPASVFSIGSMIKNLTGFN